MKDEVIFTRDGTRLYAALTVEIDHHTARRIRQRIDERFFLEGLKILVLDFRAVRFMDSSGIALILGRAQTAKGSEAILEVRGLSPVLMKLVRLSGVDRVENIRIIR